MRLWTLYYYLQHHLSLFILLRNFFYRQMSQWFYEADRVISNGKGVRRKNYRPTIKLCIRKQRENTFKDNDAWYSTMKNWTQLQFLSFWPLLSMVYFEEINFVIPASVRIMNYEILHRMHEKGSCCTTLNYVANGVRMFVWERGRNGPYLGG